jgi:hypothetical protein
VIQLAASCDVDDIEVRPVLKGWCDPMAPMRRFASISGGVPQSGESS